MKEKYTLDELITNAGFPAAHRKEARAWLERIVVAERASGKTLAQSLIDSARTKPKPAKNNVPLKKIEKAATKLTDALLALKKHPSQHLDFWLSMAPRNEFGLETDEYRSYESNSVPYAQRIVNQIQEIAHEVQIDKTGRAPELGKYRIVAIAGQCFLRFGLKPANGDTFEAFVDGIYETITGEEPTRGTGLSGQIKKYISSLKV